MHACVGILLPAMAVVATVGLVYDTWKSQQTVEMNRFQQEGQLEQAILQAIESRKHLQAQMDAAARTAAGDARRRDRADQIFPDRPDELALPPGPCEDGGIRRRDSA